MLALDSKIFIAGATGLVGSALRRQLTQKGFTHLLTPSHRELDLEDPHQTEKFFSEFKPEYVFDAAAMVGGIHANKTYPADFILKNLKMEINLIENAQKYEVKKFMFLGSTCIYPKLAQQPMVEEDFLTGKIEETNQAYAIAKIAGIVMCQSFNKQYGTNFLNVMPTGLYGINDNFHPQNSHVIPGMLRRFHESKLENKPYVELWGTGSPKREFLFSDDLADACLFLMENYNGGEIINVGLGEEVSMKELSEMIKEVTGYPGELRFDTSKPDGMPRKLVNSDKIAKMGWKPKVSLREGLQRTYESFIEQSQKGTLRG